MNRLDVTLSVFNQNRFPKTHRVNKNGWGKGVTPFPPTLILKSIR